jgi:hypothetical protein
MRRKLAAVIAVAAAVAITGVVPALAATNLLGDAGFEVPVVSGAVVEPVGSLLGHCVGAPPYGGPTHCWQVTFATVRVIHDDYMTGGVSWEPWAGKQLVWLSPLAAAANQGGTVMQVVPVQPNMKYRFHIWYGASPDTPAGTPAKLLITMKMCDPSGSTCPTVFTKMVTAASTADPAAIGWKLAKLAGYTNADEGLAEITVQTYPTGAPASAGAVIDGSGLVTLP